MKPSIKSFDYFRGVIDATIEILRYEEIYIQNEKDFSYKIIENTNSFDVKMWWCIGYNEAEFQGNNLQPADLDEMEYDKQTLPFGFNSSLSKVIKEITQQLKTIEKLPTPKLIEL